jgi:tripartite-type tricarboxylate transporter receptor subunit TctC
MLRRTLIAIVLALPLAALAQYPNKTIKIIVPFPPGGGTDIYARVVAQKLAETNKWVAIVDNRPGAGGNTGTQAAARTAPDGYTLVMSTVGPLAANRTLFKSLGYDPEKDFTPISLFAILPNVVVINSRLPPRTLTELVAYAKQRPRELNYGSVGVGSSQHLAGAYFEQIAGVQLTHVPYRNIAQYTPDFIAGQVPLGFQFLPNVVGMLSSGDARALAVTSPKRMTALPDVPTAKEAGLAYETYGWLALLGPAGMPKPVVDKLYKALEEAVDDPTVRSRFTEQGAEPVSPGPEELQKFIAAETSKWKATIEKAGIEPM